jgi:hypothetical protein
MGDGLTELKRSGLARRPCVLLGNPKLPPNRAHQLDFDFGDTTLEEPFTKRLLQN